MLAFGHLEIKEEKKIEEIRRILPNLGEFDQIPQIYHEKGNFLSSDGNISALRAGVPRSYGPPEFQPSELGYLVPTAHQNLPF